MVDCLYAAFDQFVDAEKAVAGLLEAGLDPNDLSLVGESMQVGGQFAAGSLGRLAFVLTPDYGLMLGGGALSTAMAASLAGSTAGSMPTNLSNFLQDHGVPTIAAQDYASHVRNGGVILELRLPSGGVDACRAEGILHKTGAYGLQQTELSSVPTRKPTLRPRKIVADAHPLESADGVPVEPLGSPVVPQEGENYRPIPRFGKE